MPESEGRRIIVMCGVARLAEALDHPEDRDAAATADNGGYCTEHSGSLGADEWLAAFGEAASTCGDYGSLYPYRQ